MYFAWNDALSGNDAEGLLALYARDAHFESPLVPHLLGTESGVLRGHDQLRQICATGIDAPNRRKRFEPPTSKTTQGSICWASLARRKRKRLEQISASFRSCNEIKVCAGPLYGNVSLSTLE